MDRDVGIHVGVRGDVQQNVACTRNISERKIDQKGKPYVSVNIDVCIVTMSYFVGILRIEAIICLVWA